MTTPTRTSLFAASAVLALLTVPLASTVAAADAELEITQHPGTAAELEITGTSL